ncbi:hypothetical protein EIK77_004968 [Talaromyces pinophilus]|nr:hypothetical protein EIK77_004968 [Talaromyces pinophilus]
MKLFIGRRGVFYVPENIARQITSLAQHRDKTDAQVARFPEIDDDVAHTLIHYLYTGDYQTLKRASTCRSEYSTSLLAYHAGLHCGLDGLAEHGRKYMRIFDNSIPLFDIISLGRKYFPRINDDAWFSEYLTTKVRESFETEEDIFEQEEFFRGFGEAPEFDRFLGKVVANAYARKVSSLREALDLKRMVTNSTTATALNRQSAANNSYYKDCAILGRCKDRYSLPQAHIRSTQEKLGSSSCDEVWSEADEHNEADPSPVNILTPSSGTAPSQSDSDLGCNICPDWHQHSTHEELWKSCPSCKSHMTNMFTRLILSQN